MTEASSIQFSATKRKPPQSIPMDREKESNATAIINPPIYLYDCRLYTHDQRLHKRHNNASCENHQVYVRTNEQPREYMNTNAASPTPISRSCRTRSPIAPSTSTPQRKATGCNSTKERDAHRSSPSRTYNEDRRSWRSIVDIAVGITTSIVLVPLRNFSQSFCSASNAITT